MVSRQRSNADKNPQLNPSRAKSPKGKKAKFVIIVNDTLFYKYLSSLSFLKIFHMIIELKNEQESARKKYTNLKGITGEKNYKKYVSKCYPFL